MLAKRFVSTKKLYRPNAFPALHPVRQKLGFRNFGFCAFSCQAEYLVDILANAEGFSYSN